MSEQSDWSFVSGLVSAQSERLMDASSALELLEAGTPEDLHARLRASLLFAETAPSSSPADDVNARFADIVRDLAGSAPGNRVADLFLREQEWLAFRRYVKAVLAGKSDAGGREAQTETQAQEFSALWNGNVADARYQAMADAARPLRELAGETVEDMAGLVDRAFDAHEVGGLRQTARAIGGRALPGWIDLLADLRAALAAFRAARLGWDVEKGLAPWHMAGFDRFFLFDLARARPEDWPVLWERLGLPLAAEALHAADAPTQIERAIDARIAALSREARGIACGPEVLFAFLWALRGEALNLRIVLTARACGMDRARVAEEIGA